MDCRAALTAVDADVTTFLLVATAVVEALDVEFSAVVGVPVGLLAGLLAVVCVATSFDDHAPARRRLVSAYAAVGLAVPALFALSYANVGAARAILSAEVVALAAVATALAVYATLWAVEERGSPA